MKIIKKTTDLLPNIKDQTLEMVFEISRDLVNKGYGGLFVIGDPSSAQPDKIVSMQLSDLGLSNASEKVKFEGIMFVSSDGTIQDAALIEFNDRDNKTALKSETTHTQLQTGDDCRRETAKKLSVEFPRMAFVFVSLNGTIEIIINGKTL